LDVCVLSAEEAGRLEHYGVWPQCKAHIHIKKREALDGAKAGTMRFLGGLDTAVKFPVSMITMVRVQMWKPQQTHLEDGTKIMGLKIWGLAHST